jgi:GLPGLI family protein
MVAIFVAASAFAQGMYWESITKGGPLGEKGMTSKSYVVTKKMRHEAGDGQVVIIRLDKDMMYMVNPAEKTYSEMTFAELEAGMKKAFAMRDAQMADLQEKLKNMPAEQTEKADKMPGGTLGGKKEPKIEVQGPGERKTISGYSCVKYMATSDGKTTVTSWVTKDVKGFDAMKRDWQEAGKRMASMNPNNGKAMAEAFAKIDGFPIQMEMEGGITMTVTKVDAHSTPSSEFEVPAGYKKVDSPLKNMGK